MVKLFKQLKPYTKIIAVICILVLVQAITDLYLPTLMSDIVDKGIVNQDTEYILKTGGIMLLIAAGGSVCTIVASLLSAKVATGFSRDLRIKVFSKVESFTLKEVDKIGTASLITRNTNDINQIQQV
jgi:ATP-binding cassette subfamily B multidrug efflux pump